MHFAFHSPLHFMSVSGMQTSGAALIPLLKIIYLIAFNQLGQCFVRWQWRGLPHAVQILEEVTGVEGDLTTILVYIPAKTAAVLTLARVAKQPKLCVCVRVCVFLKKRLQVEGTEYEPQSRQKLSHLEEKTKLKLKG